MSTENLARTVIEGGRLPSVTRWCRYENGALRAGTRNALAGLAAWDADAWIAPRPPKIGRHFRDKLSAPERWLDSQVGRPWHLVRGELIGASAHTATSCSGTSRPCVVGTGSIASSTREMSRSGGPFQTGSARATILQQHHPPKFHS